MNHNDLLIKQFLMVISKCVDNGIIYFCRKAQDYLMTLIYLNIIYVIKNNSWKFIDKKVLEIYD